MPTASKTKKPSPLKGTKVAAPKTHLAAYPAIAELAVDHGVKKPRGIRQTDPDSMLSQIHNLTVGEVFSRAVRIDVDTATLEDINTERDKLDKTMSSLVARANKAAKEAGERLSMSMGEFRTRRGDMMICFTVTRLPAKDEKYFNANLS